MNEGHSEEGNYIRTVDQKKPQVVMRNIPDGGIVRDECLHKDFKASKLPILSGNTILVDNMEWIFEMEMVFESCDCSDRKNIVFAVEQLKTRVLSWWKLLVDSIRKGGSFKLSWEMFLE